MFWRQIESGAAGSGCLGLMHLVGAPRSHRKEQQGILQCLGLGLLRH